MRQWRARLGVERQLRSRLLWTLETRAPLHRIVSMFIARLHLDVLVPGRLQQRVPRARHSTRCRLDWQAFVALAWLAALAVALALWEACLAACAVVQ